MARVAFKQCDVERLLRAAQALGLPASVEVLPDGTMRLLTGEAASSPAAPKADNDVEAELEAFARRNGYA